MTNIQIKGFILIFLSTEQPKHYSHYCQLWSLKENPINFVYGCLSSFKMAVLMHNLHISKDYSKSKS